MYHYLLLFLVNLCLLLLTPTSNAQEFKRLEDINSTGTSYNIFAKQGEATLQVLVLGNIGSSGVYEIGAGIELDQLLALSGVALPENTDNQIINVTVRLFREGAGRRELVYEAPLSQMLSEPGLYPALQDGDLLTIDAASKERNRITFLEGLRVIGALAAVVTLVERLTQ